MGYSYDDFICDISNCLKLAETELQDRINGKTGESTIEQLEKFVIPDLSNLLSKIKNKEKLSPKQDRYLISFANAFKVWGWNMNNPSVLYLQLLKIHENYGRI
jgi:hypothetical protein